VTPRMLVAGFGNVLRGDDGFGVEVVRRLMDSGQMPPDVTLLEIGTGGIALAQALLTQVDRLIVVDAMTRGGEPGDVYVLQVDSVETLTTVDMHMAVPARALGLAKALGALPREVFLVGCEPMAVDDLALELSPPVKAAVERAIIEVRALLARAPAESGEVPHHV
jgi:hydrogenase maturation protease